MNTEIQLSKENSQIEYSQLREFIRKVIMKAYQYCGQSPKGQTLQEQKDEFNYQTDTLIKDLSDAKFKRLTLGDIELAFERGLKGEYGDYHGLNNKSYNIFLRSFAERKTVTFISPKLVETTPTPEQLERIAQEAYNTSFETFKKTGEVVDIGNTVYKKLWNDNLIRFEKDKWDEYLREAEKIEFGRLNNELESANARLDKPNRVNLIKELDKLAGGDSESIVKAIARRLALKDYFNSIL